MQFWQSRLICFFANFAFYNFFEDSKVENKIGTIFNFLGYLMNIFLCSQLHWKINLLSQFYQKFGKLAFTCHNLVIIFFNKINPFSFRFKELFWFLSDQKVVLKLNQFWNGLFGFEKMGIAATRQLFWRSCDQARTRSKRLIWFCGY